MSEKRRETLAVILAAGKGTRMKSDLPKVLHTILGKPLVSFVIDACALAGTQRTLLVIGHQAERVKETIGSGVEYALQAQQLGTGHALLIAAQALEKGFAGDVLVLVGDAPFLSGEILHALLDHHRTTNAAATMMTAIIDPPPAYGRIVRDGKGRVLRIVEQRDATPEERLITEVNTSHYCFRSEKVFPLLGQLGTDNDQGEYYLTDIIAMLSEAGERIETLTAEDPDVLKGINDKAELAGAETLLKAKMVEEMRGRDIHIADPAQIYIEADVKVGDGSTLHPFTVLRGRTAIGKHCVIGPHARLDNAVVGDHCKVETSVIQNRKIPDDTEVGPFAALSGENAS